MVSMFWMSLRVMEIFLFHQLVLQCCRLAAGIRDSCSGTTGTSQCFFLEEPHSVLFLHAAGVQPTLDPCAKAFYKQAHCASPGREGVWLMMCANVCVTVG